MKKIPALIALMLSCVFGHAQTITVAAKTITVPSQKVTQSIKVNNKTIKFTVTVPAQTITVPAQTIQMPAVVAPPATSTLPAGLTWANGVLTVAGSVTANSLGLSNGAPLPTSSTGLYLLQLNGGFLQPTPYPPLLPGANMVAPVTAPSK